MAKGKYICAEEVIDVLRENNVNKPYAIAERLFNFAVEVIKATRVLPRTKEYSIITYQLVKSATSIDANYEEAQGSVSRADFSNKIGICLKECRETAYWVRLIIAILQENEIWKVLKKEASELQNILGSIYTKVSKKR